MAVTETTTDNQDAAGSVAAPRHRTHAGAPRPKLPRAVAFVAISLMALLWLVPLLWAFVTSIKTETDAGAAPPQWLPREGATGQNYTNALAQGDILVWMGNSVLVAVAVTVITVAVSAAAGYAFSRTQFRGRRWLFALTVAAIMVPPQILIVPLFQQALLFNTVDTYVGIILPQVVAPIMVFILKNFFDGIPVELEEAARMDGASRLRIFWSIVLPLSRGILSAVAIFVFIGAWNNFLWPFIVTNDPALMTLPVGLQTVINNFGVVFASNMARALIAAAPMLLVFLLFQRQIVQGVARTGLGGQ